ncbi:MAG: ferric reductase-like transmembrane domain-containing protein [Candidatus Aenigmarchaeota archaeon]|nr:ferric reductase-like transmembrane domain-containing protein [Candidatus Aenigmarchaeota archaeon]
MKNILKIHLAGISIILLILLIGRFVSSSSKQLILIYVSSFGFLALLSIMFVLSIPVLVKLKKNNFTVSLLVSRRWIGIYTFVFALIHVFLVFNFLFNWDINKIIQNPNRLFFGLGTISFLILAVMSATSNDKSVRILGKNWKRLHYLIYVVLVLIVIHSFNIGKIFMKNVVFQIIIGLMIVLIIIAKIKYRK